jgi:hypothetical protein
MESVGFITTLQRGAEWAATGKVTQKVPAHFPSESESLSWEYYEDIQGSLKPFVKRMQVYEVGKSTNTFHILKKLIRDNQSDQEKMDEYHAVILGMLKSRTATVECKKILCKEFSWMANDSYREVYEQLKQSAELADEAQYALDIIEN